MSTDRARRTVVNVRRDGQLVHAYLMQQPEGMNRQDVTNFALADGAVFTIEIASLSVEEQAEVTP